MDLRALETAVESFLRSPDPAVLCIRGVWGVGKTFAWNKWVKKHRAHKAFATYSYVSLFGVNTLEEIKSEIFEKGVPLGMAGQSPTAETIATAVTGIASAVAGKLATMANASGMQFAGNVASRWGYLTLAHGVICFDDLERHSPSIKLNDIMGLANELKIEKQCKVILLLNSDALGETEQNEFPSQLEKVADHVFTFDPSPEQSIEIGLNIVDANVEPMKKAISALGISNIRVIQKAKSFYELFKQSAGQVDDRILQQASVTCVIGCFCAFMPREALPLSYVRTFSYYMVTLVAGEAKKKQEANSDLEKELAFANKLYRAGFGSTDDLDLIIFSSIERGYFVKAELSDELKKTEATLANRDKLEEYRQAWRTLSHSFKRNEKPAIDNFIVVAERSIPFLNLGDVSAAIVLLKRLGRLGSAKDLIKQAKREHQNSKEFWSQNRNGFSDVKDEDLKQLAERMEAKLVEAGQPLEVLKCLAQDKSWSPEDLQILADLSVRQFQELFMSLEGEELESAIRGALFFRNVGNKQQIETQINDTAIAALRKIGKTSKLNAYCVQRVGITL